MRRGVLLPVLTLVMGLTAGLVLVEGALRALGFANPPMSRRDDYCGTLRRPRVEFFYAHEGGALVRFNAAGFRDEEWTLAKPSNTFRVAVLGDSYVEAMQIPLDARFTKVLERELDGSRVIGGKRAHVMSFGVSGFGTAQELMCLRQYVWQYSPDLVVLAVTTGNDVRNNSRVLQNDDGRPYFSYVNEKLVLDDSFRRSRSHRRSWAREWAVTGIDHSRMAQFAYTMWQNRSSAVRRAKIDEAASAVPAAGEELGLDTWIYAEPTHPLRQEAWRITEGLFHLMSREVADRGARFVLVTLSNGIQVHPDAELRARFMQRLGVSDLFYPDRRIAAAGERDGYDVLNLAPLFYEHVRQSGAFLHGFGKGLGYGHWNGDGHREAGVRLAEHVRQRLESADVVPVPSSRAGGGSQ